MSGGSSRASAPDCRRTALGLLERRLSTGLEFLGRDMTWRTAVSTMAQGLARALRDGRRDFPVPLPK